mmetsp:Transcript_262/g.258  ORF Transcript_262/g.258 Transcript_262/m.258 type:complete len:271 (-) Transcript_262:152-964(-)
MKSQILFLALFSVASAFVPSSNKALQLSTSTAKHYAPLPRTTGNFQLEPLAAFAKKNKAPIEPIEEEKGWDAKTVEYVLLTIWLVGISGFILENNFVGPWPLFMKTVPERVFYLTHMVGGMLFGGGIILTTCIERLVANSKNASVLQFWFDKVPALDGLIVVPALTASMISGTGLSIVRYGGLNIAPPHVDAIFWTLLAFMSWWGVTDLSTQGAALESVNEMYDRFEDGETDLDTPKVVVDRHVSNVVSCFFVLILYSMMVLKPGTLFWR